MTWIINNITNDRGITNLHIHHIQSTLATLAGSPCTEQSHCGLGQFLSWTANVDAEFQNGHECAVDPKSKIHLGSLGMVISYNFLYNSFLAKLGSLGLTMPHDTWYATKNACGKNWSGLVFGTPTPADTHGHILGLCLEKCPSRSPQGLNDIKWGFFTMVHLSATCPWAFWT